MFGKLVENTYTGPILRESMVHLTNWKTILRDWVAQREVERLMRFAGTMGSSRRGHGH